ncbi:MULTISPECIES: hypothetical protein [Variovorax]|uniref:hypothetical protein n=1 Tax=Variovorax TaxID=34072 RepID=UPI00286471A2|nr:hypothetical protein [Variovorax sp. 3319]MDR6891043.1 hypothetical protein [Variovorax sp. 3319]
MPLSFLYRLQHVQLPVRVVEPEEVRRVSVLLATGLIEAEIVPLKVNAPYVSPRLATVFRITEEGRAEIVKMGDIPKLVETTLHFGRGLRLL